MQGAEQVGADAPRLAGMNLTVGSDVLEQADRTPSRVLSRPRCIRMRDYARKSVRGKIHFRLSGGLGESCFQQRRGPVIIQRAMPPTLGWFGSKCRTRVSADRS